MSKKNRRIDVHAHIIPKPYVEALAHRGITGSTYVDFPRWTPRKAVKQMDRSKVEVAVTSLSTPGVWFGDAELARRLSRLCNEFQAQMVSDYPGRFGSLACLPLPDVEGALVEMEYALDDLGHEGVVLLSDIDGHYLGDPAYEEVFAELDRRRSVVFIHPHNDPTKRRRYDLFSPLFEWVIHTTRAAIDLLYSGRLARYPSIRYVLAHGGGTLPFIAHRVAAGLGKENPLAGSDCGVDRVDPETLLGGLDLLRRLYYDTASPGRAHLTALQEFVGVDRIVFGTDAGWTPPVQTSLTIKELLAYDGFKPVELERIERGNLAELFPHLLNQTPEPVRLAR